MKRSIFVAACMAIAAMGASAQQANPADHTAHHPAQAAPAASEQPQSEGEVRRIDLAQGKVTLRHGPLANLDMPAMTMVFVAADKKLLEGLKEGDKVRFTAVKDNGAFVVTSIQPAN